MGVAQIMWEILIAMGALTLGIICFTAGKFVNAKKDSKSEGEFRGELKADLRHIMTSMNDLNAKVDSRNQKTDEAILRLHKRLDDHIEKSHTGPPV